MMHLYTTYSPTNHSKWEGLYRKVLNQGEFPRRSITEGREAASSGRLYNRWRLPIPPGKPSACRRALLHHLSRPAWCEQGAVTVTSDDSRVLAEDCRLSGLQLIWMSSYCCLGNTHNAIQEYVLLVTVQYLSPFSKTQACKHLHSQTLTRAFKSPVPPFRC